MRDDLDWKDAKISFTLNGEEDCRWRLAPPRT